MWEERVEVTQSIEVGLAQPVSYRFMDGEIVGTLMPREETDTQEVHDPLQSTTVNVQFLSETHSSSFCRPC